MRLCVDVVAGMAWFDNEGEPFDVREVTRVDVEDSSGRATRKLPVFPSHAAVVGVELFDVSTLVVESEDGPLYFNITR